MTQAMERVTLGSIELSRIVYGMWRLGDAADTSPGHVAEKIEACLEQGITTMDQADIYGGYGAEAIMGAALKERPALKGRIEIVTKCDIVIDAGRHAGARVKHYDTTRAHVLASVEASLSEMGVDVIDLLLIHRPDPLMDHRETGAALDEVVASGKVREVGVSNFRPWDVELLQSATEARLVTNQIEISLAATAPFTNGDLAFLQQRAIPPMAWSPLGGGSLMTGGGRVAEVAGRMAAEHGVDAAAIAVAFLLRHPARIMPVMGTNTLGRIRAISDAAKVDLSRQDWFELYEAATGAEVP